MSTENGGAEPLDEIRVDLTVNGRPVYSFRTSICDWHMRALQAIGQAVLSGKATKGDTFALLFYRPENLLCFGEQWENGKWENYSAWQLVQSPVTGRWCFAPDASDAEDSGEAANE